MRGVVVVSCLALAASFAQAGDLERRLAVLYFKANLVKSEEADIVSDRLRSEFVNQKRFVVVDRKNMEAILKEQQVQLIDCTETECAIQMGEILNVRWIVLGSLSRVEGDYFMTAELVDVQTAQVRCSVNRMGQKMKDLFKVMPQVARELGCTFDEVGPVTPPVTPPPEPDRPYVAPLPVPVSTGTPPSVRILDAPKAVMNRRDAKRVSFRFLGEDERCIDGYRYQVDDGDPVETKRAQVDLTDVPRGSHVFQVQAKDCDGNYSTPQRKEFQVIDEPPSVRIVSPSSGQRVRGKTLAVVLEGSDDGAIARYRCAVKDPKEAVEQTGGTFSFDVADGRQRIYAQVIDDAGGQSAWVEQEVEFAFDDGTALAPSEAPKGFVALPSGTFTMGSPPGERGRDGGETPHQVTITKPFFMQTTEVTVEGWETVMGRAPSRFRNPQRPVDQVTWFDTIVYCNRRSQQEGLKPCYYGDERLSTVFEGTPPVEKGLVFWDATAPGYRLPTEAEWEYGCRAGTSTAYPWGDSLPDRTHCWFRDNAGSASHDVGETAANAWGLRDMNGNVAEWCWDWYGPLTGEPARDPTGPPRGELRVQRGGSWKTAAAACRSAARLGFAPGNRSATLGFRVVRNAR